MKMLHVSDLHVENTPQHEEWLELAEQEFERLRPDLILVTGDLTNEGKGKQFKLVKTFLETLEDFCDVRVIPGNRDVKKDKRREKYQKHIAPELDFFSRDTAEGIAIAGLNSTPKITKDQRAEMKQFFGEGQPDELRLFCAHHSFFPVPTKKLKEDHIDLHAGAILQELIDLHVDLLCCGHIHRSHVWTLSGLLCCSVGSLFDRPGEQGGFIEIQLGRELRILKRSLFLAKPAVLYDDPHFKHTRQKRRKAAWR